VKAAAKNAAADAKAKVNPVPQSTAGSNTPSATPADSAKPNP
jgi:hypothetical protein